MGEDYTDFEAMIRRGIGTWGASLGDGQHRFRFVAKERVSQVELFDRVAGLLHREIGKGFFIRALYLYPPDAVDESGRAQAEMLLLGHDDAGDSSSQGADVARELSEEYERLGRLVVAQVADLSEDHYPSV